MYLTTIVYLFGITGVISALQNNTVPLLESHAVVKVSRGVRNNTDTMTICSKNADLLEDYFSEAKATSTFHCNNTDVVSCEGWPDMKKRYSCACKDNRITFAGSKRECVRGSWLRKGCSFRFGSWRYSTGWNWNKNDGPLLSLYVNPGFALTGSISVSTRNYKGCDVVNISTLNQDGQWEEFTYDTKTLRVYKLHNFFQLSWIADQIDSETSSKMSGRIFRLYLSCDIVQLSQWDPMGVPLTSCLVFKATGDISFTYNKIESRSERNSSSSVAVALGVTFGVILVIIAVILGICFYRRRRGQELSLDFSKVRRWCGQHVPSWRK